MLTIPSRLAGYQTFDASRPYSEPFSRSFAIQFLSNIGCRDTVLLNSSLTLMGVINKYEDTLNKIGRVMHLLEVKLSSYMTGVPNRRRMLSNWLKRKKVTNRMILKRDITYKWRLDIKEHIFCLLLLNGIAANFPK